MFVYCHSNNLEYKASDLHIVIELTVIDKLNVIHISNELSNDWPVQS